MCYYKYLLRSITLLLFASSASLYAEEVQFTLQNKQFKLDLDSDFEEVPHPAPSVLLALRDRNGYPTLNAIVLASPLPRELDRIQTGLLNDYKAVGLQDARVSLPTQETLPEGLKSVIATAHFTSGSEKLEARILIIPYEQHQVLFTFLFKETQRAKALKRWLKIKQSITGPAQASPQTEKDNSPIPFIFVALLLLLVFIALGAVIYRRKVSQGQ